MDLIGLENIESIELGNEPNSYGLVNSTASQEPLGPPMFSGFLTNQT